ncbi:MAG: hypothetical protein KIS65_08485 [Nitrosomonas sp.]|nr:hypothetical protein [Nitrosomonas sp.]MCW5619229.1 hypothetical protein [Nitrosomonas sp.]
MNKYSNILLTVMIFCCTAIAVQSGQHTSDSSVDVRMIGIWQGEYAEKDGALKSWVQTRNEDGTYRIEFRFVETDGTMHPLTEEGQWWIENGLFYELAPSWMEQPDVYQYRFQDDGCITFLLVESQTSAEDVGQYRFVECLSHHQPST